MNTAIDDNQLVLLIERVSKKDTEALKKLYAATSGKMLGIAMRIIGNREQAEDILQDAYLKIWRIAEDYRQSLSPPIAWMGIIVRSRALDVMRKNATEKHLQGSDIDDDGMQALDDAAENPMDTALASEQAWALHECLKKIEAKPREVLVQAYFKDLSHGELAAQLSLPLGTVKTWIRRSLEQLRTCLARFA
jgi:RNA polymerase sigma factor (sigma-70 family)